MRFVQLPYNLQTTRAVTGGVVDQNLIGTEPVLAFSRVLNLYASFKGFALALYNRNRRLASCYYWGGLLLSLQDIQSSMQGGRGLVSFRFSNTSSGMVPMGLLLHNLTASFSLVLLPSAGLTCRRARSIASNPAQERCVLMMERGTYEDNTRYKRHHLS